MLQYKAHILQLPSISLLCISVVSVSNPVGWKDRSASGPVPDLGIGPSLPFLSAECFRWVCYMPSEQLSVVFTVMCVSLSARRDSSVDSWVMDTNSVFHPWPFVPWVAELLAAYTGFSQNVPGMSSRRAIDPPRMCMIRGLSQNEIPQCSDHHASVTGFPHFFLLGIPRALKQIWWLVRY